VEQSLLERDDFFNALFLEDVAHQVVLQVVGLHGEGLPAAHERALVLLVVLLALHLRGIALQVVLAAEALLGVENVKSHVRSVAPEFRI
jgi:hypothetical protein